MGMCFGVRDAIAAARVIDQPGGVTVRGELVHNPAVIRELDRRGFSRTPETARDAIPVTPRVMITAHGISERERRRLESAGKELVDTTCPLVRGVHVAARSLADAGFFVVVIGKPGHVEVEGIVGDLDRWAVVETADQAESWDEPRIGVVCQTTVPPRVAQEVLAAIVDRNRGKEIRFEDTVCQPTRQRQEAVLDLIDRVDALVVVGGRNSNNTRELARLAASRGVPWVHVEGAADLDPAWFEPFGVVGLTAGTSTLDETVDEVHRALASLDPAFPTPACRPPMVR